MIKKHKIVFSFCYLLFSYLLFFISIKVLPFFYYSNSLLLLFTFFNFFIYLNFIVPLNKLYDFIYCKRYLMGFLIFSLLVIFKFNGSAVFTWNEIIEPESSFPTSIVIGKRQTIRSDEWLVGTPEVLTQATKEVNYNSNNTILRGTKNLVTMFPNLPSRDLSLLSCPRYIGYMFLDTERAFSFSWYLPYFLAFFTCFEFFMIITKKNRKYSLLGTLLIVFSPVVQWWQSSDIFVYGMMAILAFYYFVKANSWKKRLLFSILFGYSGFLYLMCLYPAWQVPYAYFYLIMLIWIIKENKEKLHIKDLLYLTVALSIIIIPTYILFKQNAEVIKITTATVYPGSRNSTGGGPWDSIFTYIFDIYLPYKNLGNPCELSQFICLFPLPLIMSAYLIFKRNKKDLLLVLMSIVQLFLVIWSIFPLPEIVSKLTLMYMSTVNRTLTVIGFLSVIEMIYIMSIFEDSDVLLLKSKKNYFILLISFCLSCVVFYLGYNSLNSSYPGYLNIYMNIISFIILFLLFYLFLNNNFKANNYLTYLLIAVTLISSITVIPINKGLKIMYEKPLAKKIKSIVKKDDDALFISADKTVFTANYISVNGAKTINTINHVPNLKLYHKLDPQKKYNNIYNRYAHVEVDLVDKDTSFELVYPDRIKINMSYDDVCKIGVDYLVTDVSDKDKYDLKYKKIYGKYNKYIYKTNCDS